MRILYFPPFWYYLSEGFQCEYLVKSFLHHRALSHICSSTYIYIYTHTSAYTYTAIDTDIGTGVGTHLSIMLGLQYQRYPVFCMGSSFIQTTRTSLAVFEVYPCLFLVLLSYFASLKNFSLSSSLLPLSGSTLFSDLSMRSPLLNLSLVDTH